MEFLLKIKLRLDAITRSISDFTQRKYVKITLSLLYWFIVAYLAYDFYRFGIATGNSTLLTVLIIVVLLRYLRIRKEKQEQNEQTLLINRENNGYCDKCGAKIDINYGDAYKTLCKKCA